MEQQLFLFEPIFRRYLWGGRRLAERLGKAIGEGLDCAESWEIVDRREENSRIRNGPSAGTTLRELLATHGREVLGERVWKAIHGPTIPPSLRGRFPLLLKYLDANQVLSVQVHPDDRRAALLDPPDRGKTEAWYVIEATPDSVIWCGLRPGVTPEMLGTAVRNGSTESLLHAIHPRTGNCILVPAGTVHAIGAGLLIAEIQQASDTTYRLFDWNRVDAQGQPRPLHVDQAIDATDFERGPVSIQSAKSVPGQPCEELVRCDPFFLRRWTLDPGSALVDLAGDFRIITVIEGHVSIDQPDGQLRLQRGETALISASLKNLDVSTGEPCVFLEIGPG